ncbi:MAG: DUF2256 domain-containing protein [Desulfococcaceae bacterium]
MEKKRDLPTKIRPVCGRPSAWRRRWRDCRDSVRHCGARRRGRRNRTVGGDPGTAALDANTGA